jgi:small subunit ribosomal protein S3
MGQKVNPNIFRLHLNNNYLSNWYANKKLYSNYLKEDDFLRNNINFFLKNLIIISNIYIYRILNKYIYIKLDILYPKIYEIYTILLNYLKLNLNIVNHKMLIYLNKLNKNIKIFFNFFFKNKIKKLIFLFQKKINKKIFIKLNFIKNPYYNVNLITKIILEQIKKRISYRRILNQIITKIENFNIKGIKIQISGRLDGIEIARSEWKKYGIMPLQTLTSNIMYNSNYIKTNYGIIGVKTWLYI